MNTLKKILFTLLGIIVLAVIVSLFLPSKMKIERTVAVKADHQAIFDQVNNLRNWNNWNPWNQMDPSAKMEYTTPESGAGAGYTWESKNGRVGKGSLKILTSTPDSIVTQLDFNGKGTALNKFYIKKDGEGYAVTQTFESEMGMNPLHKYMSLIMKGMMNANFDKGLNKIKEIAESAPKMAPADSSKTQSAMEQAPVK